MNQGMKHCLLTQAGFVNQLAWLPEEYAVKGRVLDLKDRETKEWSRGWVVGTVYEPILDYDYIRDHERDYKTQREASDI